MSNQEKRTDAKNEAKKIKSNSFTKSNRLKSNIAIGIFKDKLFDSAVNYVVFWGHQ